MNQLYTKLGFHSKQRERKKTSYLRKFFYEPTVYKTGVPQQADREREEENKLSVFFKCYKNNQLYTKLE